MSVVINSVHFFYVKKCHHAGLIIMCIMLTRPKVGAIEGGTCPSRSVFALDKAVHYSSLLSITLSTEATQGFRLELESTCLALIMPVTT